MRAESVPVEFRRERGSRFEPYNVHLIRDIGAFQIGIGTVLVLALLVRDALLAPLVAAAIARAARVARRS